MYLNLYSHKQVSRRIIMTKRFSLVAVFAIVVGIPAGIALLLAGAAILLQGGIVLGALGVGVGVALLMGAAYKLFSPL